MTSWYGALAGGRPEGLRPEIARAGPGNGVWGPPAPRDGARGPPTPGYLASQPVVTTSKNDPKGEGVADERASRHAGPRLDRGVAAGVPARAARSGPGGGGGTGGHAGQQVHQDHGQ